MDAPRPLGETTAGNGVLPKEDGEGDWKRGVESPEGDSK